MNYTYDLQPSPVRDGALHVITTAAVDTHDNSLQKFGVDRVVLIASNAVKTAASNAKPALYGFAGTSGFYLESLPTILVGRGLLGLAVAGVIVSATTLIADCYMDFVSFLPIIFGCMGIGYLLIGQSTTWAQALTGLAISGMGLGILMPNMTVWLSTAVPDAIRGGALGGLSTAMFLGQFLSPFAKRVL